jgi:hypothetical protein
MRSSDNRQESAMRSNLDDRGKVLEFRPPEPETQSRRHSGRVSESDVVQLLDLSKYEKPRQNPDEYKARMTENIAALIVLGLLVGIATTDFSDIEQLQQCATAWHCGR